MPDSKLARLFIIRLPFFSPISSTFVYKKYAVDDMITIVTLKMKDR